MISYLWFQIAGPADLIPALRRFAERQQRPAQVIVANPADADALRPYSPLPVATPEPGGGVVQPGTIWMA